MRRLAAFLVGSFSIAAFLLPGRGSAVTFDLSCYHANDTTCGIGTSSMQVYVFGDVVGYRFEGGCNYPSKCGIGDAGSFKVMASWNEAVKTANEGFDGMDGQHKPWHVGLSATCTSNPWVYGKAAAGCVKNGLNMTPNAPPSALINQFGVPASPGFLTPIQQAKLIAMTLDGQTAQMQAPKIVKPASKGYLTLANGIPLEIDPGPGSPTKTLSAEWKMKEGAVWSQKNVADTLGIGATKVSSPLLKAGQWQLRARAHQTAAAKWSPWVEFEITELTLIPLPHPPPLGTPGCTPQKPFDAAYSVSATPTMLKKGVQVSVPVTVTNKGSATWSVAQQFRLSYHWFLGNSLIVHDGLRTNLPGNLASCKAAALNAALKAPDQPGTYTLRWDMLQEGVAWFSETYGVPPGNVTVTITP